MGQKMVKFSDLSGELITDDHAVARIVIQEHPELAGAPVEIEVLADEARAVGKAAVQVAVVDMFLPGEEEPRHVAVSLEAFDKLATDKPMSELLITARPARKAARPREKRATAAATAATADSAAESAGTSRSSGRGARTSAAGSGSASPGGAGKSRAAATAPAAAATTAASPASAASLAAAGLAEAVA
ncbi:MAG TPA: hypothetical protein VFV41_25550 [Streptosporangiaceae bacterium]|nr:hypothetical protein [Streptosporangiaceae bacterium]